jgi:hypothetical protein
MLSTITTTRRPATDLGYLLHKNPDKFAEARSAFSQAIGGTLLIPEVPNTLLYRSTSGAAPSVFA